MPSFRSSLFKVVIRLVVTVFINDYYPKKYLRFVYSNVLPLLSPEVPGVSCEALNISGIPAAWLIPDDADEGNVVLYLHGGAYVIGSIASHRDIASQIAAAARSRVLLVDYRLAPENRFPAAVEDAVTSYRWLLSQGYAPEKIVMAGDSAGGGLTVAAMVSLRDSGDPMPAAAMLLSPWTDLEVTGESVRTVAWKDPMINAGSLRKDAAMYLGETDARNPLASPIYANLEGLPPVYIQVGTAEILLDDARRLAERARADDVTVELDVWEGMFHVWQFFSPIIPESKRAVQALGEYARGKMLTASE